MRLTLPALLTGVAFGGARYVPAEAMPYPMADIAGMPPGCAVYAHEGAVHALRKAAWLHPWDGGSGDWPLCVALMTLDHDDDLRLRLGVANNADIWTDARACGLMPKATALKGYEWPGPDYRRGPR